MQNANYMEVLPGGHCFICHKDYEEYGSEHPCFLNPHLAPIPCTDACKDSKYKIPDTIKIKKPEMIIHNDPSEDNVCDGCQ